MKKLVTITRIFPNQKYSYLIYAQGSNLNMTLVTNMSSKNNLFRQSVKEIREAEFSKYSKHRKNWKKELRYRQNPAASIALGKK